MSKIVLDVDTQEIAALQQALGFRAGYEAVAALDGRSEDEELTKRLRDLDDKIGRAAQEAIARERDGALPRPVLEALETIRRDFEIKRQNGIMLTQEESAAFVLGAFLQNTAVIIHKTREEVEAEKAAQVQ